MLKFSQSFDDDEWTAEDDAQPGIVWRGTTQASAMRDLMTQIGLAELRQTMDASQQE